MMIKREQSILPLSKREAVQDEWLHTRLNDVLKESMQESEIHTWLTISKEYNEDPIDRHLYTFEA